MRIFAATNCDACCQVGRRCWAIVLFVSVMVLVPTAFTPLVCAQDKDEKPKPRTIELVTKDGKRLRAFYFPSEKGKAAKTVLLVHEWKGQASPYAKLVVALRDAGCAVLVPDYRGHGGSREQINSKGKKAEMATDPAEMKAFEVCVNDIIQTPLGVLATVIGMEKESGVRARRSQPSPW